MTGGAHRSRLAEPAIVGPLDDVECGRVLLAPRRRELARMAEIEGQRVLRHPLLLPPADGRRGEPSAPVASTTWTGTRDSFHDDVVDDFSLGRVGVWTRSLDRLPIAEAQDAAGALEQQGYGTLWVPEVIGREPLVHAALLLSARATSWSAPASPTSTPRSAMAMQSAWKTLTLAFPERFVLGLGVSQSAIVEGLHGQRYGRPYRRWSSTSTRWTPRPSSA